MLLYRIGKELFLTFRVGETKHLKVYDGSQGDPNRFYLFTSHVITTLVIIRPGMILINALRVDQLDKIKWLTYETGRDDNPIDVLITYNVLVFLYSDLTHISIIHINGELYPNVRDGKLFLKESQAIKLPIISLFHHSETFFAKSQDEISPLYKIITVNDGGKCRMLFDISNQLIDPDVVEVIDNEYKLYSTSRLEIGNTIYHNVLKYSYNGFMLNNSNELKILDNDNRVVYTIENVKNFHFYRPQDLIYMIIGDQLICKDGSDEEVLLEEGASEVKFPTQSYYDMIDNNPVRIKSARKC